MEQYISKAAVVAEIRRIMAEEMSFFKDCCKDELENTSSPAVYTRMEMLLYFLDTIEVKEVGNVWHDASETPKGAGDNEILVQFADFHASVLEIDDWEYLDHQTKWAYLKDLT